MTYSGVGTHGKNGITERGIKTVVHSSRTMMMHQVFLWPEKFDVRLWSFVMENAVYLWNHAPNADLCEYTAHTCARIYAK